MVGLNAGMFRLEAAFLGAVVRIPRLKLDLSFSLLFPNRDIFRFVAGVQLRGTIPRVRVCRRNGALGAEPISRFDSRRNEADITTVAGRVFGVVERNNRSD